MYGARRMVNVAAGPPLPDATHGDGRMKIAFCFAAGNAMLALAD